MERRNVNLESSSYVNWKSAFALFLCLVFCSSFLSGQDTTPPELISLTFSPTQVNVANSDQTVDVDLRIRDDLSGVNSILLTFESPSKGQQATGIGVGELSLISGTAQDGTFRVRVTINRFAETGDWTLIRVMLNDQAGNAQFPFCEAACLEAINAPTKLTVVAMSVNNPPVVFSPGNQSSNEGDLVSLQISASDPDGDTLTYSATGLPSGLFIGSSTGLISGRLGFNAAGNHTVTVSASDGTLSASVSFNWLVTNTNRPPQISNPGQQTSTVGDTISLRLSASDADGDTLTLQASGLPPGLSISSSTGIFSSFSGLISGTLGIDSAGSFTPTVSVSDSVTTTSISFSWTIAEGTPPEVTPPEALVYPQLALGGGFQAVLLISNKTASDWEGTSYLRRGNDQDWTSPWVVNGSEPNGSTSFDVRLGPDVTKKFVLTGDAETQTGYLQITGNDGFMASDITVSFFYNVFVGEQLVDSIGVPASSENTGFLFPVEKTEKVDTGFAWAPSSITSPFQITLSLFDSEGNQVQQTTLPYEGHLASFFSSIFENVTDGFVGKVLLESENAIHLTVLRLEVTADGSFQLTSISPDNP